MQLCHLVCQLFCWWYFFFYSWFWWEIFVSRFCYEIEIGKGNLICNGVWVVGVDRLSTRKFSVWMFSACFNGYRDLILVWFGFKSWVNSNSWHLRRIYKSCDTGTHSEQRNRSPIKDNLLRQSLIRYIYTYNTL